MRPSSSRRRRKRRQTPRTPKCKPGKRSCGSINRLSPGPQPARSGCRCTAYFLLRRFLRRTPRPSEALTCMSDTWDALTDLRLVATHEADNPFAAVVPPIVQTSLFTFSSFEEMQATYKGLKVRPVYSRGLNPTVRLFEEKLAAMEGAEDAIGCASGMAAISSTVLAFVGPGDRVVAVRHVYPDTYRLFETLLRRMHVQVDYVDGRDPDAIRAALPGAQLFYVESPTSWVMEAHDVGALAALAKAEGVLAMIDNSWATPVFQRPLSLGFDLVVHSASKYLGG